MDGKMLVKDMIKAIENKEIKVAELATQYSFSDRTIQTKIKNLGFEWIATEARYSFVGTDKSVFDIAIEDVFKKAISNAGKSNVRREIQKNSKQIASTIEKTSVKTPEKTIKNNSNSNSKGNSIITSAKAGTKDSDNIDRLLAGKKAKKAYRGFYLDSDVLAIIDNVDSGVKSELVNECLRKVFREKGLL